MIEPVNAGFKKSKVLYNFFYSSLSTFLNIIVPLLTYPYIARILGPANMGKLGVAASLTNYFIVAASLGLPVYGMREIARTRSDGKTMGRIASELVVISLCSSAISTIIYMVITYIVPQYRNDFGLFIIFGTTIITSTLLIEWFFQGIEQFRYIGLRNVFIKAAFIICLFILVKKESDYKIYAVLFAGFSFIAMVANVLSSTRYVRFSFKGLNLFRHMGPMIIFATYSFLITAYTNLDFLFLGLFSDNVQSGLYNISIRLARMIVTFIATLSTVLMPKLSASAETKPDRVQKHSSLVTDLIIYCLCRREQGSLPFLGFGSGLAASAFAASFRELPHEKKNHPLQYLPVVCALSQFPADANHLSRKKKKRKCLYRFLQVLLVTSIMIGTAVQKPVRLALRGACSQASFPCSLCIRCYASLLISAKSLTSKWWCSTLLEQYSVRLLPMDRFFS